MTILPFAGALLWYRHRKSWLASSARGFERRYPASLRVDTAEDVFDGAIFTSRIHGLQHDQHSPLVLRVEALLEVLYSPALLLQLPGDVLFLLVMLGLVGVYRR